MVFSAYLLFPYRDVFSSTNHSIRDCLCMIIYNCLNEQNRYLCMPTSIKLFCIFSCISQLTLDKAIWTCSPGLLKFFHYFYLCFFQDAACKRPLWTEDHFSHCSFVCWEDSTWVGVGINNQIQGAGGGGWGGALKKSLGSVLCHQGLQTLTLFQTKIIHFTTLFKTRNPISGPCLSCFVHEPHAWKIVQTLPMSLTLNKLFYSIVHVFCFLLFRTQNQVIFKTNIMKLYTYFFEKEKNC